VNAAQPVLLTKSQEKLCPLLTPPPSFVSPPLR
jgi:hypothetical protein